MTDRIDREAFLDACSVDPDVFALRPDYRARLIAVDGLPSTEPEQEHAGSEAGSGAYSGSETGLGSGSSAVDSLIAAAESRARELLAAAAVEDLPHIAAWRDAYRAFGAKPQRTRNSLEALTRRAEQGLPRVNPLTDAYNAISVLHQVPIGGEDLRRYSGPARLVRAAGDEAFDTASGGEPVVEHPDAGEVVWRDDAGATCRRWNWRQGRRTALGHGTSSALFILDALAPMSDDGLDAAEAALIGALTELAAPSGSTPGSAPGSTPAPTLTIASRTLGAAS